MYLDFVVITVYMEGGVRADIRKHKRQKKEALKAANCFKINRKRSANSYVCKKLYAG
jgi:hypothetical protein